MEVLYLLLIIFCLTNQFFPELLQIRLGCQKWTFWNCWSKCKGCYEQLLWVLRWSASRRISTSSNDKELAGQQVDCGYKHLYTASATWQTAYSSTNHEKNYAAEASLNDTNSLMHW